MRRLVDLPAPLGPRKATSSPRATWKVRSVTASTVFFLTVKRLVSPCASMIGSFAMDRRLETIADSFRPRSQAILRHVRYDHPSALAAQPAADAPALAGLRARRPARRDRAHGPPRRRAPARTGLPHRVVPGAPAATGSRRAARCRRCCSPTKRPSRWRSGCGSRHPSASSAAPRRRSPRSRSSSRCCPLRSRRRVTALADAVQPAGIRAAPRCRARCSANSRSPAATTSACASPTPRHPARSRGGASSRTPSRPRTGTGTCCAGTSSGTTGAPSASTGSARVEHTRVLFEPRPLTPEEIEEFILVARSWVRQAVEADAVMDLPIDAMRECVRAVGAGRRARGRRRARGGRSAARTCARRCTGCPGSRRASSTRPTSPSRRAPSCARRSSGCCAHWMPRHRRSSPRRARPQAAMSLEDS